MKPGKLAGVRLSPPKRSTITDPEKIFLALTLRGDVENFWGPQVEAWREWDGNRTKPDVVIEMNTGGGKTLVGLVIAQSVVNETRGNVLYVCPTKQLAWIFTPNRQLTFPAVFVSDHGGFLAEPENQGPPSPPGHGRGWSTETCRDQERVMSSLG